MPSCTLKTLPLELQVQAAKTAIEVNPQNAIAKGIVAHPLVEMASLSPQRLAVLTARKWGQGKVDLGVTFMDTQNTTLKNKILAYANKWGKYSNTIFRESASGQVRLSLTGDGYWSYLGTDILSVPNNQPTLNLQAFSLSTPDSEYDRVVCHEFGHTMGFPHEHERSEILNLLDVEKTVRYFLLNDGWDRQTVMQQIFDPIDPSTITATAADVRSIMCYEFPGDCTKSGQPIPGGNIIDTNDISLVGKIYPLPTVPPVNPPIVNPPVTAGGTFTGDGSGTAILGLFGNLKIPVTLSGLSLSLTQQGQVGSDPQKINWPTLPAIDWTKVLARVQIAIQITAAGLAAGKSWAQIAEEIAVAEIAAGLGQS